MAPKTVQVIELGQSLGPSAAERRRRVPLAVHVVLVEADADALRVDLHELGQGIQQAAGDGHGLRRATAPTHDAAPPRV